jgi:hypothetical protein
VIARGAARRTLFARASYCEGGVRKRREHEARRLDT